MYSISLDDDAPQPVARAYGIQPALQAPGAEPIGVFNCSMCERVFRTSKQLAQHERIKHNKRCLAALCLPNVSTCMYCGTKFDCRGSLVLHLLDLRIRSKTRGTSCGLLYLQSKPTPLPRDQLTELDAVANKATCDPRKTGHTQVRRRVPAKPRKTDMSQVPHHPTDGRRANTKKPPARDAPYVHDEAPPMKRRRLFVKSPAVRYISSSPSAACHTRYTRSDPARIASHTYSIGSTEVSSNQKPCDASASCATTNVGEQLGCVSTQVSSGSVSNVSNMNDHIYTLQACESTHPTYSHTPHAGVVPAEAQYGLPESSAAPSSIRTRINSKTSAPPEPWPQVPLGAEGQGMGGVGSVQIPTGSSFSTAPP